MTPRSLVPGFLMTLLALPPLPAQIPSSPAARTSRPLASHVILPQTRTVALGQPAGVQVDAVDVGVVIVEQVATTTMDILLRNPSSRRVEAELLVPVPDSVALRGFTFRGAGSEPSAQLLPIAEARRIYDSIVSRVRDPALLEFIGYNLIRSSVFPLEARGEQKVRLTYEHILTADGDRVDYVLPRSESIDYKTPWNISVKIKSGRPISTVYSPSHPIDTRRAGPKQISARLAKSAVTDPGPFRISCLLESGQVTASLQAYPDPAAGGGYFLLLAGLPATPERHGSALRREVTLVIDRSGSMNGEKLEQVREAALQVLAGLENGEAFNIIVYNEAVDYFSEKPVVKSADSIGRAREYLRSIQARGGTNIHDALVEALRPEPTPNTLPLVLFLTDGLPTIGQTSEVAIRALASSHNRHGRRIFTFGVGVDVNTPLLENIAFTTRGFTTFVLPHEDVEVKVAGVFRRLTHPVLAGARIEFLDAAGQPARDRVRDLYPAKLPDLFAGDQLVLLGRYRGEAPLTFVVRGNYLGKERTFQLSFDLDRATTRNSFVPRLWATRKIGMLVDAVRLLGADIGTDPLRNPTAADRRLEELVGEIVRLSTEFGVLTEYTAFLAREGTDLSRRDRILAEASSNFKRRAWAQRTGSGGANQDLNCQFQKGQAALNVRNEYLDENLQRVEITAVQQVSDRAFYRRHGRWVDSRIVGSAETAPPAKVLEFGSEEFRKLALRLAREGRQGCVSLRGDILLLVDREPVLVKGPKDAK